MPLFSASAGKNIYNERMGSGFLRGVITAAEVVNGSAGRALSRLLPLMTAVTLVIIVCGAVFRVGWVWLGEAVVYMHAILFMLAAAYTLGHNGHVRIDVLYGRMSERSRAWVNLVGSLLLLLPTCAVIFFYSLPYVIASWQVLEHSPEGSGLPAVFLLKSCIPLAALMLTLEGLAQAARAVLTLTEQR